jgi:hypothetical protein
MTDLNSLARLSVEDLLVDIQDAADFIEQYDAAALDDLDGSDIMTIEAEHAHLDALFAEWDRRFPPMTLDEVLAI